VSQKAVHQVKDIKVTDATKDWLEAECIKHPELTAQEIIRKRLHEIALKEIEAAKVLIGVVSRREIRGDGGRSGE
jgi:hypothetical protein